MTDCAVFYAAQSVLSLVIQRPHCCSVAERLSTHAALQFDEQTGDVH